MPSLGNHSAMGYLCHSSPIQNFLWFSRMWRKPVLLVYWDIEYWCSLSFSLLLPFCYIFLRCPQLDHQKLMGKIKIDKGICFVVISLHSLMSWIQISLNSLLMPLGSHLLQKLAHSLPFQCPGSRLCLCGVVAKRAALTSHKTCEKFKFSGSTQYVLNQKYLTRS